MAEFYDVKISVRVFDAPALFEAALKHAVEVDKLPEADARALLTDGDGPDVGQCLQMLFDPGASPSGCEIEESGAEFVSADDEEEA